MRINLTDIKEGNSIRAEIFDEKSGYWFGVSGKAIFNLNGEKEPTIYLVGINDSKNLVRYKINSKKNLIFRTRLSSNQSEKINEYYNLYLSYKKEKNINNKKIILDKIKLFEKLFHYEEIN